MIKPKNIGLYHHHEYDNGFPFVAEEANSIIELVHRTQYSIYIISNSNYDATAEIKIDNELVGNFMCLAKKTTKIHRPVGIDKAFVFISQQSSIAARSNIHIDSSSGFIQVIIRPQDPSSIIHTRPVWQPSVQVETDGGSRNVSFKSSKSGTNGQQQKFGVASAACGRAAGGMNGMHNGLEFGATAVPPANSLGATVLGDATHQTFSRVPQIVTSGRYLYNIQLVIGNPYKNVSYYLEEDNSTSHYQALRHQNL